MATFITSKLTGETINIYVETTTGYWKYQHDNTTSSIRQAIGSFDQGDGSQSAEVLNENGEFTIISCLSDGTVSGDITYLDLSNNQLTEFNGTGLSGLTFLYLDNNGLTSFDGTGLSGLTYLNLANNGLTEFDGTGLSSLTYLYLSNNQLTEFDGTGLSSLTYLNLANNGLTEFDGTGLTSLYSLWLNDNGLTTLDISNQSLLRYLQVQNNILTASVNNSLLAKLASNQLTNNWSYGGFKSTGGRTSTGNADYNYLIGEGWLISGVDIKKPGVKGVGQLNP